jgi:hypothetical protein
MDNTLTNMAINLNNMTMLQSNYMNTQFQKLKSMLFTFLKVLKHSNNME